MKNMAMSKEEITESRKKLGLNKGEKDKKAKFGPCSANACPRHATVICKYCNMAFCRTHSDSVIATTAKYVWSLDRSDYEKYKKYNEDWQRKDGHPCVAYTEYWNTHREEQRKEEYKKMNEAYNTLFSRSSKSNAQNEGYQQHNQSHYSYDNYGRNASKGSRYRGRLSQIYDKWLLKNALVFSIVIAIIATLPIGLLTMSGQLLNTNLFISTPFLIDFVAIFIIFAIYRKMGAHSVSYWAGLTVSFLSSILLLSVIDFTSIVTVSNFVEALILLFIASYVGNLIGKGLSAKTYGGGEKALIYFGRAVLIILAIVIIASLSLHISSFLKANNTGGSNQNLVNSSLSDIGKISNTISSVLSTPQINSTWATEFFNNVSVQRGEPYTYCANLSKFAGTRFNTMAQNYGISHYGYSEDFNKTWPSGVQEGDEIYYGFGEEVFYPSGYNASNYVQQIITTAPLHWQELEDRNLTTYGYYIANGPSYEILGPNGGYTACPVTEIPGPNVNISQYFAQYGCSVETANLTYFVIEIASLCPYGG